MAEQQPSRFCSLLQSACQLWEGGEQMPQVAFLRIIRLGWGCWRDAGWSRLLHCTEVQQRDEKFTNSGPHCDPGRGNPVVSWLALSVSGDWRQLGCWGLAAVTPEICIPQASAVGQRPCSE